MSLSRHRSSGKKKGKAMEKNSTGLCMRKWGGAKFITRRGRKKIACSYERSQSPILIQVRGRKKICQEKTTFQAYLRGLGKIERKIISSATERKKRRI